MDVKSESTMPRITEVVQTHEAADKLKEAVTQDSEAAGVAARVEGLAAEEDTAPKTSSTHKAVALVVSRAAVRTSVHKASNEIEPENQASCAFTIGWRSRHQPYTDTSFSGWQISAWRYGGLRARNSSILNHIQNPSLLPPALLCCLF